MLLFVFVYNRLSATSFQSSGIIISIASSAILSMVALAFIANSFTTFAGTLGTNKSALAFASIIDALFFLRNNICYIVHLLLFL